MKRQIMLVDDENGMLDLVGLILQRQGFSVLKARDAFTALALLESSTPDLFVLDVMMPGIDGFHVCETVRATPSTSDLPIIMLSAKTDMASANKGLRLGANKYLTKPISPEELTRQVRDVLQNSNSRLEG